MKKVKNYIFINSFCVLTVVLAKITRNSNLKFSKCSPFPYSFNLLIRFTLCCVLKQCFCDTSALLLWKKLLFFDKIFSSCIPILSHFCHKIAGLWDLFVWWCCCWKWNAVHLHGNVTPLCSNVHSFYSWIDVQWFLSKCFA